MAAYRVISVSRRRQSSQGGVMVRCRAAPVPGRCATHAVLSPAPPELYALAFLSPVKEGNVLLHLEVSEYRGVTRVQHSPPVMTRSRHSHERIDAPSEVPWPFTSWACRSIRAKKVGGRRGRSP
ncbi:hypothetical protein E2C01_084147 [Portunus trituberculatus]|uniref:Uncharacterized protein n=1 Tax=Portunus trituberculatus TaxID=210409 RepID=A0A5B7IUI9_PORTR|nr:hypothetical protein [Portunus trituberculatus]